MNIKEFAEKLDGMEYDETLISSNYHRLMDIAKDNGFVVVYGASDDLIEFDGAYRDEAGGVFDGGIVTFDKDGTSDDGKEHRNTGTRSKPFGSGRLTMKRYGIMKHHGSMKPTYRTKPSRFMKMVNCSVSGLCLISRICVKMLIQTFMPWMGLSGLTRLMRSHRGKGMRI